MYMYVLPIAFICSKKIENRPQACYGVATISRLLKNIGLFCKILVSFVVHFCKRGLYFRGAYKSLPPHSAFSENTCIKLRIHFHLSNGFICSKKNPESSIRLNILLSTLTYSHIYRREKEKKDELRSAILVIY